MAKAAATTKLVLSRSVPLEIFCFMAGNGRIRILRGGDVIKVGKLRGDLQKKNDLKDVSRQRYRR